MTNSQRSEWCPTEIRRFIRSFPSGAGVILVETDEGKAFVKAIGNPGGEQVLACEFVGTQLAQWFGLSTFDFRLIEVREVPLLPFAQSGSAVPGPAFITRYEEGEHWSGTTRELKRLENPQDISRLVVFDTWTLNCDRLLRRGLQTSTESKTPMSTVRFPSFRGS